MRKFETTYKNCILSFSNCKIAVNYVFDYRCHERSEFGSAFLPVCTTKFICILLAKSPWRADSEVFLVVHVFICILAASLSICMVKSGRMNVTLSALFISVLSPLCSPFPNPASSIFRVSFFWILTALGPVAFLIREVTFLPAFLLILTLKWTKIDFSLKRSLWISNMHFIYFYLPKLRWHF